MVESCSTTHLTHNTDSFARSSPIPPWFIPIEVSAKKGYSDRFLTGIARHSVIAPRVNP
jgi:hypothetical protein